MWYYFIYISILESNDVEFTCRHNIIYKRCIVDSVNATGWLTTTQGLFQL